MTDLEYLLIIIIWIGYGGFSTYQQKDVIDKDDGADVILLLILFIALSPLVFIIKSLYGAFKEYN